MSVKIIKEEQSNELKNTNKRSRKKKKMPLKQVVSIGLVAIMLSSTVVGAAASYGLSFFQTNNPNVNIVYATDSDADPAVTDVHDHDHIHTEE